MTKKEAVSFLIKHPEKFGQMLGFTKLTDLHNEWIRSMLLEKEDQTLQASRGTYKTTCVSIALSLIILLYPNMRTMFMRKTDSDIKEVIKQVQRILADPKTQYFAQTIYGVNLKFNVQSNSEILTNLTTDVRGTSQLIGIGTGSSLTGKHFDYIFTDDIVNVNDRVSKAEREHTRLIYQELQNIKNRGGRIFNTGTPWHEEDAFSIMPNIVKFNCYHERVKDILTSEELEKLRQSMVPSLFAANYELRHIASEDAIFLDPRVGGDPALCEQGVMHLDSAFYGEDFTAWTIMTKHDDTYYVYGQMRRKHVDECYDEIKADYDRFMANKLYNETNADKGMVGKELRKQGFRVILYQESMNKYLKIVTYLKKIWSHLVFVDGTDPAYIQQVCDYYEEAEHDDAPDSVASLARIFVGKEKKNIQYTPLY